MAVSRREPRDLTPRHPRASLAAVLAGWLLFAGPAAADGVLILKSNSGGPYDQAAEGALSVAGADTAVLDMAGSQQVGPALVARIRAADPVVIVALGQAAAKLVRDELPAMPTVFCLVLSPESSAIMGPNTTGVRLQIPYARQFAMIQTLLPNVGVVGILYNPFTSKEDVSLATREAKKLGMKVKSEEVGAQMDVPEKLEKLLARKVDLLCLPNDSTVINPTALEHIVAETREVGVPVMTCQASLVDAGALVALAPSYRQIGMQAARMAARILAGTAAADIPMEPPDGDLLALNLRVAADIGVEIPRSLVDLADHVVEE